VPWLLAQVPATFAAAAIDGVLEGWLAIDGSTDWWPLTPACEDIDDTLIFGAAGIPMATVLDAITEPPDDADPLPRRRPAAPRWPRLAIAAVLAAVGALWYLSSILGALLNQPAEILDTTFASTTLSVEPAHPRYRQTRRGTGGMEQSLPIRTSSRTLLGDVGPTAPVATVVGQ
jgi:hypothetical protein